MIAERPTPADLKLGRIIEDYREDIDRRLPDWARRSNPIVRRHLGRYWKTILPEPAFLMKAIVIQVGLILLTFPLPFMFDLTLPAITASILLFPVALYGYAHILIGIGSAATTSIVAETRNDTITLLRTIPIPLTRILASKVAAALWRQVENLTLLLMASAILSLPMVVSHYATVLPLSEYPYISRLAMMLSLTISLVRLILEPFMVGAIGILIGAVLPNRSTAVILTTFLGALYFVAINMVRLAPLSWPLRYLVDFILPVVLPLVVIWLSFRITQYLLTRD
ncbi:MAG: hypothetical protein K8I60_20540 [Anaerolineae bacterium]|nr:hypothetical protein [Anaerolineae bacterium]